MSTSVAGVRCAAVVCAVTVGSAALVAGCGTVEGAAVPKNPTASEPAFDPCDDIPDEAIRAIGMDPATEARDILGVHQPGWNICGWNNATHSVAVFSSNYSIEDVRRNPSNEEFADLMVRDRSAVQYRTAGYPSVCDIAVPSVVGSVLVTASSIRELSEGDPCEVARRTTDRLLAFLPR